LSGTASDHNPPTSTSWVERISGLFLRWGSH
jgi:hypothetical protein